jgi:hypothetical protein
VLVSIYLSFYARPTMIPYYICIPYHVACYINSIEQILDGCNNYFRLTPSQSSTILKSPNPQKKLRD